MKGEYVSKFPVSKGSDPVKDAEMWKVKCRDERRAEIYAEKLWKETLLKKEAEKLLNKHKKPYVKPLPKVFSGISLEDLENLNLTEKD